MTGRRSRSIALTLALAGVATFPGMAGLASASGSSGPAIPVVISGAKKGPVDVSGSNTFGTVASLRLPKGAWAIFAKGFLTNPSGAATVATCRLVAGHDSDTIQADPFGTGHAGETASFLLNIVHVFASAGRVNLKCASPGATGDLAVHLIRIVAVEAGRLTKGQFGGPSSTTGTGKPRIISKSAAGPSTLSGNDVAATVASMTLPKGPWFIVAKLSVDNTDSYSRVVCTLAAGPDRGQTKFGLNPSGQVADHRPAGVQTAHVFGSSGPVALRCSSSAPSGVEARSIRMTAIQAGRLTIQSMGSPPKTTGSGIPQIISVHRDGDPVEGYFVKGGNQFATVASTKLPAGKWAFLATGYLNDSGAVDTSVTCKLVAGADHDDAHLTLTISSIAAGVDGFELEVTHAFSAPNKVILQCGDDASTNEVQIFFARITAMRAGTLTRASL